MSEKTKILQILSYNHWLLLILLLSLCVQAQSQNKGQSENDFIWKQNQATVLSTGDLKWKPKEYIYQPGSSVRFIDYENGSDNADGLSRETPWKHHPWDPNAGANSKACTGIHTYVFKRGVVYRGRLINAESGTPEEFIKLTSDPEWGSGEAMIVGSVSIRGGWKSGDSVSAPNIPEPGKVYYTDISSSFPETKYVAEKRDNELVPLKLARIPNWEVTDSINPMRNWWKWTGVYKNATRNQGGYMIDTHNLNQKEADYWKGGTVWTEWQGTMGTVWGMKIAGSDPVKNSVTTENEFTYGGEGKRYYIDNLPQLLDASMEYWFDKSGNFPGRLYVRLTDERNPNTTEIEVAVHERIIQLKNVHHVSISGLSFALNTFKDYHFTDGEAKDIASVINLNGYCHDVEIKNCRFNYVNSGISVENNTSDLRNVNNVTISDNQFTHVGDNVIAFGDGNGKFMEDIYILRNRLYNCGFRQLNRWYSAIPSIVGYFKTAVVAGNIIDFSWGSGIYLHWGKGSSDAEREIPFIKGLVFQNRVENSLLGTSDYGGIEHWQGGPAFYYNNYAKNAPGWRGSYANNEWNPWGFPYYFDGSFKFYAFNNIAVSPFNSLTDPSKRNRSGYQMVLGMYGMLANNTSHNFYMGITTHKHSGGVPCYNRFLGNIFSKTSYSYFKTNDDNSKVNFDSYANNVFAGSATNYWKYSGGTAYSLGQFKWRLESLDAQTSQLGWTATKNILPNASDNNFLPLSEGEAIDRGVKFFAPIPLYGVVGEWHFYPQSGNPDVVVGENFYMTNDYTERGSYDKIPKNNLKLHNRSTESFQNGELEDWTKGAFSFDGITSYCSVPDNEAQQRLKCNDLDMSANNFIIETYLKTAEGHTNSTIISKTDAVSNGYSLRINEQGNIQVDLLEAGVNVASQQSAASINDGDWHHILAEVTRNLGINVYIDGKIDNGIFTGIMPPPGLSLENNADFMIGKDFNDRYFQGTIDFVRLSKGNLSDAETTIEELYEWQFNGPFLRDFAGNDPIGKRDAGALESGGNTTDAEIIDVEIKGNNLVMYPNPVKDKFIVQFFSAGNFNLEIVDQHGRIIMNKKITNRMSVIDASSLNTGIYVVRLFDESRFYTGKMIKE